MATQGTESSGEMPAEMTGNVTPQPPPTMEEAFMTLCRAMVARLDDDMPSQMHAEEIMGWYVNGNTAISWKHAVLLLEQVIGVAVRG